MATLTESSVLARKIIRYSLYGFTVFLALRFALFGAIDLYKKIFPKKPEATLSFGKLPVIPTPQKEIPANLTYTLELPQGSLPQIPELGIVYFMPPSQRSITALEDARAKAGALNFSTQERTVAETIPNVYVFQSPKEPSNFTINIVTGVFSVGYNFESNPQVLFGIPPNAQTALNQAHGQLKSAGVFSDDFSQAPIKTTFTRVENELFKEVSSLSEANLTRIDLFRKNYGEKSDIPAVTPNFPNANVWFMFGGFNKNIVVGEFHFFAIDKTRSATYPLKSAQAAFEELISGGAFIANSGGLTNGGRVTIRRVYLAYYDAGQYTPFYQPVIVFEGDNNFAAFVPAIAADYYGAAVTN